MIAAVLLLALLGVGAVSQLSRRRDAKRLADARRRESMRQVTERWHFREWERDLRSSDPV